MSDATHHALAAYGLASGIHNVTGSCDDWAPVIAAAVVLLARYAADAKLWEKLNRPELKRRRRKSRATSDEEASDER